MLQWATSIPHDFTAQHTSCCCKFTMQNCDKLPCTLLRVCFQTVKILPSSVRCSLLHPQISFAPSNTFSHAYSNSNHALFVMYSNFQSAARTFSFRVVIKLFLTKFNYEFPLRKMANFFKCAAPRLISNIISIGYYLFRKNHIS